MFVTEVIPVWDASMFKFSEPSPLSPVPAKSLTSMSNVTELPRVTSQPVINPSPAVIVT